MLSIKSKTFFITHEGQLQVRISDQPVNTLVPGHAFGGIALMYNCPRAATVKATSEGTYWKLDRDSFNNIVKDAAQKKRDLYETFLKSVPLLSKMTAYELSQVADALQSQSVEDGKVIVSEGEDGATFYIVAGGTAEATKKDSEEKTEIKVGDYFGELALLNNAPRAATVTAKTQCKVLTLDSKSFKRLIDFTKLEKKEYA